MSFQKCKICSKEFRVFSSRKRFFCSRECMGQSFRSRRGNNNPNWKGNKVKYQGLHKWVRDNYGTPSFCENKNCIGKSKRYHWASKKGFYGRDRKHWLRLCNSCHMKLDWSRPDKKELKVQRRLRMLGNKYNRYSH